MNNISNRLVISVDLDEWYHARWVSGSKISRWSNTIDFFRDVYKLDTPRGDIEKPTMEILELFDNFKIKATFFILSEVASYYPSLVKEIIKCGHEVSSHGKTHVDLWKYTRKEFYTDLKDAKSILEEMTGKQVLGYRAPNLIIEDWIVPILSELGFQYDSSVCPSRKLMGKFGSTVNLPMKPYYLSEESFIPGNGPLFEIPIPVFPYLKLPAATGIMTRVIGEWWSTWTLKYYLKKHDTLYYFHPYEMLPAPDVDGFKFMQKLHTRRSGLWMKSAIKNIFEKFQDVPKINCIDLMNSYNVRN